MKLWDFSEYEQDVITKAVMGHWLDLWRLLSREQESRHSLGIEAATRAIQALNFQYGLQRSDGAQSFYISCRNNLRTRVRRMNFHKEFSVPELTLFRYILHGNFVNAKALIERIEKEEESFGIECIERCEKLIVGVSPEKRWGSEVVSAVNFLKKYMAEYLANVKPEKEEIPMPPGSQI